MLVVDPERRFTVDQCMSHPWMTQGMPGANDSTDGLVGGLRGLDVQRRGVRRERTMLSSLNSVEVTAKVPVGKSKNPVKVFSKNAHKLGSSQMKGAPKGKESDPSHNRDVGEFMHMGGKGDQDLFANDGNSVYSKTDLTPDKQNGNAG